MPKTLRRLQLPLFVVCLACLLLPAAGLAESPFDGHWQGSIELPTGGELEIDVDLASGDDSALTGDISIPVQGIRDLDLSDLSVEGREVRFAIPGIPGDPNFDGTLDEAATTIAGTFRQGGAELPFELVRGDDLPAVARKALAEFDPVIEQAIGDFNVPGLAIAIVAGGEVVYARGFGKRDLEGDLPMTADSLFAIGSTTKAMTATVLGMQVDEGMLEWDEPLMRYLPGFRLADAMITARITPRDLLTHRSGLPRHDLLWYNNNQGSRAELIERFADLELTADLREKFQYNNLLFMTAGHLAGRLDGGKTWEEVVRTRLFDPLEMTRSNFSVDVSQQDPDHALPYRENDDDEPERIPFRRIDLIGPAGSVNSSVNEMSRWLLFNLRQGKVGEKQLVQAATLADLQSPHMTIEGRPERTDISASTYGMGWGIDTYRGHRRVGHGGGIDGFVTSVMLFPDDDLGLVAFTNRGSGLSRLVNQTAADRILDLEPVDWIAEALERLKKGEAAAEEAEAKKDSVRVADTRPSHPIADYAGSYRDAGYGHLEIKVADAAANALEMTMNGITTPLVHWHYDVWNGAESDDDPTFEDQKLLFRSNYEGQIHAVESPLELTAAPIVFDKQPDARLSDPAYLERFVGTYEGATDQQARIALAGDRLTLHVQGQPVYTLVPAVSGRFNIEGLQGFSIGFEQEDGRVTKAVSYQPNGVFDFVPVEE